MKRMHKHHTLPVGASIETIDWHLKHLFSGGFHVIKMLTPKQHIKHHKKHGYEKFSNDFK